MCQQCDGYILPPSITEHYLDLLSPLYTGCTRTAWEYLQVIFMGSKPMNPSFLTKLLSLSVPPPFSFFTNYFFMKTVLPIGFELVISMIIYSFNSNNIQPSNGHIHPKKCYFYKLKYYTINGFKSKKITFLSIIKNNYSILKD